MPRPQPKDSVIDRARATGHFYTYDWKAVGEEEWRPTNLIVTTHRAALVAGRRHVRGIYYAARMKAPRFTLQRGNGYTDAKGVVREVDNLFNQKYPTKVGQE